MNKIFTKSGMNRVCLISFIHLYSVFTSENAFSRKEYPFLQKQWNRNDMVLTYDQTTRIITLNFLIYDYLTAKDEHAFLEWCTFSSLEEGDQYSFLMAIGASTQKGLDRVPVYLCDKRKDEQVQILNKSGPDFVWHDHLNPLILELEAKSGRYKIGENWIRSESKRAYLQVKWLYMPQTRKPFISIRMQARWNVNDGSNGQMIVEIFTPKILKSNSNSLK